MVLLLSAALAGSYDSLEIGGLWGSPTANGGEAPWWNPAGMAMDSGFRASGVTHRRSLRDVGATFELGARVA